MSRRPHDVRGMIYPLEYHFDVGCQAVARGLSLKPSGRFCSFSASKLVWLSRHEIHNFVTIRSISEPWESFFITMATVVKVIGPLYFSSHKGPKAHLHARFHQDRPINNQDRNVCDPHFGGYV